MDTGGKIVGKLTGERTIEPLSIIGDELIITPCSIGVVVSNSKGVLRKIPCCENDCVGTTTCSV